MGIGRCRVPRPLLQLLLALQPALLLALLLSLAIVQRLGDDPPTRGENWPVAGAGPPSARRLAAETEAQALDDAAGEAGADEDLRARQPVPQPRPSLPPLPGGPGSAHLRPSPVSPAPPARAPVSDDMMPMDVLRGSRRPGDAAGGADHHPHSGNHHPPSGPGFGPAWANATEHPPEVYYYSHYSWQANAPEHPPEAGTQEQQHRPSQAPGLRSSTSPRAFAYAFEDRRPAPGAPVVPQDPLPPPSDREPRVPQAAGRCPKVFMYDLPWPWDDFKKPGGKAMKRWSGMAKADRQRGPSPMAAEENTDLDDSPKRFLAMKMFPDEVGVWNTRSSNVMGVLLRRRVLHSKCTTTDPKQADLFLIPMWLASKLRPDWETRCQEFVQKDGAHALVKELVHLTPENAHRHMLVNGKNLLFCEQWWNKPYLPELEQITRLATRFCYAPPCRSLTEHIPILTLPYPSMVYWSSTFGDQATPWAKPRKRAHLMSLIMSQRRTKVSWIVYYGWVLRAELWRLCSRYGRSVCQGKRPLDLKSNLDIFRIYSSSEFCLQPQGDTCERKGILDSLLAGCIPVLFNEPACPMNQVFHHHWGPWQNSTAVFFNVQDILDKKVDVKATLEAIPQERRARMRATIAKFGHLMQYNVEDPPEGQDDALTWAFRLVDEGRRGDLPPPPRDIGDRNKKQFLPPPPPPVVRGKSRKRKGKR